MAVSKRLRYEVLRRDNHACRYCGAAAPDAKLHVDHVIPQSLGGADHPTNLVTACTDCNSGKTSSMPGAATVADVDQDAFRQAAAMKRNEQYAPLWIFIHAWFTSNWAEPSKEVTDRVWDDCQKLYELGVDPTQISLAAAVAGLHGTTRMHAGLPCDGLNAIGSLPGRLRAEEAWAQSWLNASPTLSMPSDSEREELRASIKRVRATKQHTYGDIYAAATTAGAYHDTSLEFHLPSCGSAIAAAAIPPPRGDD